MLKRLSLFISLFAFIMVLALSLSRDVQAEEVTQPIILPFTHAFGKPLSMSTSDLSPEIEDDVLSGYSLPITEMKLNDIHETSAQGYTTIIAFQTRGFIDLFGSGSGSYNAQVFVAIDHADGSRTVIRTEHLAAVSDEGWTGKMEKVEGFTTLLDEWLDLLHPGDTLVVGAMAQGRASSGLESGDQVIVTWEFIDGNSNPFVFILQFDHTYNPDTFVPYLS